MIDSFLVVEDINLLSPHLRHSMSGPATRGSGPMLVLVNSPGVVHASQGVRLLTISDFVSSITAESV